MQFILCHDMLYTIALTILSFTTFYVNINDLSLKASTYVNVNNINLNIYGINNNIDYNNLHAMFYQLELLRKSSNFATNLMHNCYWGMSTFCHAVSNSIYKATTYIQLQYGLCNIHVLL